MPEETRLHEPPPVYYSNVLRVATSLYDVAFVFGSQSPAALEGEEVRQRIECIVHMSPAHAKTLLEFLSRQLASYEARFGELPGGIENVVEERRESSGENQ